MSKMKTKILDNIDENNNLFENVPGDNPPLKPEVVVKTTSSNKIPKDGNPQLEDYRIISCIDAQTYIGGTGEIFDDEEIDKFFGTLSFQYRSQPLEGGFMWKIGLTPVIAEGVFIPWWGAVSIGYCW